LSISQCLQTHTHTHGQRYHAWLYKPKLPGLKLRRTATLKITPLMILRIIIIHR